VADPGRLSRDNFIAAAKELGLNIDLSRKVKFAEGDVRHEITWIDLRGLLRGHQPDGNAVLNGIPVTVTAV
jgi:hypothetical protein